MLSDSPSLSEPEAKGWRFRSPRVADEDRQRKASLKRNQKVQLAVSTQPEDPLGCTGWTHAHPLNQKIRPWRQGAGRSPASPRASAESPWPASLTSPPPLLQACTAVPVTQSCVRLPCDPTDYSLSAPLVHGIFQGKHSGGGCHALLQGSSPPGIRARVPCTAGGLFTDWSHPGMAWPRRSWGCHRRTGSHPSVWERWEIEVGRSRGCGWEAERLRLGEAPSPSTTCLPGQSAVNKEGDWALGQGSLKKGERANRKLGWGVHREAMRLLLLRIICRK